MPPTYPQVPVPDDEFGVRDMLVLLNNKIDKVLEEMDRKADQTEVLKLRDRMHRVEGGQAMLANFVDMVKEMRGDLHDLDGRVSRIEVNSMSEAAVEAALASQRREQRTMMFQLGSLLGVLGIGNFVVNLIQNSP